MKIRPEHYSHMVTVLTGYMESNIEAINQHEQAIKEEGIARNPALRLRWDIARAAGLIPWFCSTLYSYMDDSHIDTAIRKATGIV